MEAGRSRSKKVENYKLLLWSLSSVTAVQAGSVVFTARLCSLCSGQHFPLLQQQLLVPKGITSEELAQELLPPGHSSVAGLRLGRLSPLSSTATLMSRHAGPILHIENLDLRAIK